MHTPRATIDFSRQSLSGDGQRHLFRAPVVGELDDEVAGELFHALREEVVRTQAAEEVPRLERVTLRIREGELQVLIHAGETCVRDWIEGSERFRGVLERALERAYDPPTSGADRRRP